jgi:hypothetical protein
LTKERVARPSGVEECPMIKSTYAKAVASFGGLLALAAVVGAGLKW